MPRRIDPGSLSTVDLGEVEADPVPRTVYLVDVLDLELEVRAEDPAPAFVAAQEQAPGPGVEPIELGVGEPTTDTAGVVTSRESARRRSRSVADAARYQLCDSHESSRQRSTEVAPPREAPVVIRRDGLDPWGLMRLAPVCCCLARSLLTGPASRPVRGWGSRLGHLALPIDLDLDLLPVLGHTDDAIVMALAAVVLTALLSAYA